MQSRERRLFSVVLAAGRSSRFGASKLCQHFRGRPLLAHAAELAEQACPGRSLLVLGNDRENVLAASGGYCRAHLVNEAYAEGMGTSLAAAAQALQHCADGLLVLLGDQPLVTAADVERLIATWRADPARIVTSRFRGTSGPPAIFPAAGFEELAKLGGDQGAKAIVQSGHYPVMRVDCENAAVDIDRPSDLDGLHE